MALEVEDGSCGAFVVVMTPVRLDTEHGGMEAWKHGSMECRLSRDVMVEIKWWHIFCTDQKTSDGSQAWSNKQTLQDGDCVLNCMSLNAGHLSALQASLERQ